MTPRFVIVVPTFDNPDSIAAVVRELLAVTDLPVLVVDDGSRQSVADLLREAGIAIGGAAMGVTTPGRVEVLRHAENRGKGAALRTAFATALGYGYTHVVSFDGDGQHLASQVRLLLAQATARPWDVVIGVRRLSTANVPTASRFGRWFSNFWIRYETGVDIRDSQSGMRVYPLFHIQTQTFSTNRYDFEVEVLTRLLWAGAELAEVEIDVHYPPAAERVSHFDKLRDNARITLLNTRFVLRSLFFRNLGAGKLAAAMLVAPAIAYAPLSLGQITAALIAAVALLRLNVCVMLAWLVAGRGTPATIESWLTAVGGGAAAAALIQILGRGTRRPSPWSGKMRGGRYGKALMAAVSRRVGLRGAYGLLAVIVPYFYLFAPTARRASLEYLRGLFPDEQRWRLHARVMAHLHGFGLVLIDRLHMALHGRDGFALSIDGRRHFAAIGRDPAQDRGGVFVTAHVGGWDLASQILAANHLGRASTVAEYVGAGRSVRVQEQVVRTSIHNEAIPVLAYKAMLERGELVGMMADRPLSEKLTLAPFFGRLAAFDLTPFRTALSVGAPVLHCFTWRIGLRRYQMSVEPSPQLGAPRSEPLAGSAARERLCEEAARSFAAALEAHLRRHPFQWFNFFPFFSARPRPALALAPAMAPAAEQSKQPRQGSLEEIASCKVLS